jgi:hypothetical protein
MNVEASGNGLLEAIRNMQPECCTMLAIVPVPVATFLAGNRLHSLLPAMYPSVANASRLSHTCHIIR